MGGTCMSKAAPGVYNPDSEVNKALKEQAEALQQLTQEIRKQNLRKANRD